jgi:hypothetical protein
MAASKIPLDTLKAYRHAAYRVLHLKPFELNIGGVSQSLLGLYNRRNFSTSAFLTAYNPQGVLCSNSKNKAAQSNLVDYLIKRSVDFIDGISIDKKGRWPNENSVLALDVTIEDATMIGLNYNQNAFVWMGEDAKPELILLR